MIRREPVRADHARWNLREHAVNLIRSVMTGFMVTVLIVCAAGWIWTADQPPEKRTGSRIALGLSGLMAAGCATLIWKEKPSPGDGARLPSDG